MTCRLLSTALAFAVTLPSAANAQEISISTVADSHQIGTWLRSPDPRLVAWGAYFANKQHDAAGLALLPHMMEQWTPPANRSSADERPSHDEMIAVVDAVIETHMPVTLDAIRNIADVFPEEASILVTRIPLADAMPLLLKWYAMRGSINSSHTPSDQKYFDVVTRVAAMLLEQAPPPHFAGSILADSEEHLTFYVLMPQGGLLAGSNGGCHNERSFDSSPPIGWPPLFAYDLKENARDKSLPFLFDSGADHIAYSTRNFYLGVETCFRLEKLNSKTRHHLIAQMLGVKDEEVPWKARESVTIRWSDEGHYLIAFNTAISEHEQALLEAARSLVEKGVLTPTEEEAYRTRLAIHVIDLRRPPDPPLPHPVFPDPRTYFATMPGDGYSNWSQW